MKRIRKWVASPVFTLVIFAAAAGLLMFSTIGGVRAQLEYQSQYYTGEVKMYDIGVSLLEKSHRDTEAQIRSHRDYIKGTQDKWDEEIPGVLLVNMLAKDKDGNDIEGVVPGYAYNEELSAQNTGTINEYVRMTIYKYWTDPDGNKVIPSDSSVDVSKVKGFEKAGEGMANSYVLSPDLIHFNFINQVENGGHWILDTQSSAQTEERMVFYYNKVLQGMGEDGSTPGEITEPVCDTLTINVADKVTQTNVSKEVRDGKSYTSITTTYDYDGWRFWVEAEVDAVQEHNAVDAIKSAWGRDVAINNGTLTLID